MNNITTLNVTRTLNRMDGQKRHHAVCSLVNSTRGITDATEFKFLARCEADAWAKAALRFDREIGRAIWDLIDAVQEDLVNGSSIIQIRKTLLHELDLH